MISSHLLSSDWLLPKEILWFGEEKGMNWMRCISFLRIRNRSSIAFDSNSVGNTLCVIKVASCFMQTELLFMWLLFVLMISVSMKWCREERTKRMLGFHVQSTTVREGREEEEYEQKLGLVSSFRWIFIPSVTHKGAPVEETGHRRCTERNTDCFVDSYCSYHLWCKYLFFL